MPKRSVGITAAWITGCCGIIAAMTIGLLSRARGHIVQISNTGDHNQFLVDSVISYGESPSTKATVSELHDRTAGIVRLPDGRVRFGRQITGTPSVVLESHEAARKAFKSQDYVSALAHSQQALRAYEETQRFIESEMVEGGFWFEGELPHQEISKLYWFAAGTAQRLGQRDVANQYAKQALDHIEKAIQSSPNVPTLQQLKDRMFPGLKGAVN